MSENPDPHWKERPSLLTCPCSEDEPFYRVAGGRTWDVYEAECRGDCGRHVRATSRYELSEAWNAMIRAARRDA